MSSFYRVVIRSLETEETSELWNARANVMLTGLISDSYFNKIFIVIICALLLTPIKTYIITNLSTVVNLSLGLLFFILLFFFLFAYTGSVCHFGFVNDNRMAALLGKSYSF